MLSYYEQQQARLRDSLETAIKDKVITSDLVINNMTDAFENGNIPKEFLENVIEAGILQILIWAHELKQAEK